MNKLFSKIAALSVGLTMAIGVGVAVGSKEARVAKADTPSVTLTASTVNDFDTSPWSITEKPSSVESTNLSRGWQWGSGKSTVITYASSKAYSKVVVTASTNGSSSSIDVSVGGASFGSNSITSGTAAKNTPYEFTGSGTGNVVITVNNTSSKTTWILQLDLYEGASDPLESITVSGSMTKTSYTTAESWSPVGLVATGHYESGADKDVTSSVTWSYNPAAPAVSVTSVVATASIGTISGSSAAQAVTVTASHAGTEEDPFTVAEALNKAASAGTTAWVTKGIISYVKSIDTGDYGNAEYYISDDGTRNNELYVYRGYYLNGDKFTTETAALLTVGKIATVSGKLKVYNSTKEYDSGNKLLALEEQSTGDVDVVFNPSETSIEIGDTGTYTATSNTAGVVFTWSVDKPEILSVNETTGAYEALDLGIARVTVTATAGSKQGSIYADITVNGNNYMTVNDVVALAATVPSGQTTPFYVYVEGFVKEFATSQKDGKPRAFDIQSEKEDSSIMVYTNINPYEAFVEGLVLGSAVRIKANVQNYNGTYELTSPEKLFSEYVAMSFAYELLDLTDDVCEGYDGVTNNHDAIEAIWETLSPKFDGLNDAQKARLVNPSTYGCGDTVKNAMARYDYLTGKYSLDNFITGRTPVQFAYVGIGLNDVASNNNTMIIVVVIAAVSALAFTTLLVFKKKKQK